jgi:hypothetical protein
MADDRDRPSAGDRDVLPVRRLLTRQVRPLLGQYDWRHLVWHVRPRAGLVLRHQLQGDVPLLGIDLLDHTPLEHRPEEREVGVRQAPNREGYPRHNQDEYPAHQHCPIQLHLALDRHEPNNQLRLGEHADPYSKHGRRDRDPPEIVFPVAEAEVGKCRPPLVTDRLELGRNQIG